MSLKILSACALAAAVSACARQASSPSSAGPDAASQVSQGAPPNRNRDLITHEELQAPGVIGLSVLDAVRSLRPQYLTVRGLHTLPAKDANGNLLTDDESGKVHASIDGNKIGPLDDLSAIRASTVKEIRYLNYQAAMQKFGGPAREGPVILVVTM